MTEIIHGEMVCGSRVCYQRGHDAIVPGIVRAAGETRWFQGFDLFEFHGDRAVLYDREQGRFGAVDRQGDLVIVPSYEGITNFNEGFALAVSDATVLLDNTGREVRHFGRLFLADEFFEGHAVLSDPHCETERRAGVYGIINTNGDFVVECVLPRSGTEAWYHVDDFRLSDGMLRIARNGRCGYQTLQGEMLIAPDFEDGTRFSEGLAGVRKKGKWGFVDRKGAAILPFEWDDVQSFSGGLAAVCRAGRWGAIDRQGREVLPVEFRELSPFQNGHASARNDFGCGLIDAHGNFIVPPLYDMVYHFHEGIARVFHHGVGGVMDRGLTVLWGA